MNQQTLFVEDIWQALTDCVRAMGGAKVVGSRLRPEVDPQDAGKWLLDCLNPSRKEKLCVEQVMWLLRESRVANCHVAMNFIASSSGYTAPQPTDPEDQKAQLQRDFIASVELQRRILTQLERLPA